MKQHHGDGQQTVGAPHLHQLAVCAGGALFAPARRPLVWPLAAHQGELRRLRVQRNRSTHLPHGVWVQCEHLFLQFAFLP